MKKPFFTLFVTVTILLFFFNGPLLDLLGWHYSMDDGSFATKMHPTTYLLFFGALAAMALAPYATLPLFKRPGFLVYLGAAFLMVVKGVLITMSGVTGGEMSTALVSFFTPALLVIAVQPVSGRDLSRLVVPMRVFFALDSLMALAERAVGHRFIPSFLDQQGEFRATAFLGHPLAGSMLTGVLIVHLMTARREKAPILQRLPEVLLHVAAMFAFGGRSALVFTTVILLLSAIFARQARNQTRISALQRALPIGVVLLGIGFVFLPIDLVDRTLDRFTQDYGSAQTRNSAVEAFLSMSPSDMIQGIDFNQRMTMAHFYGSNAGFELTWISLGMEFGVPITLAMLIGLSWLLYSLSRPLDRSAFYMAIQFMAVTAGSIGLSVKALLVSQLLVMMMILCQRRIVGQTPTSTPRASKPSLFPTLRPKTDEAPAQRS
jgi:hypothetical protein